MARSKKTKRRPAPKPPIKRKRKTPAKRISYFALMTRDGKMHVHPVKDRDEALGLRNKFLPLSNVKKTGAFIAPIGWTLARAAEDKRVEWGAKSVTIHAKGGAKSNPAPKLKSGTSKTFDPAGNYGISHDPRGDFTAHTASRSRDFKTYDGAHRWLRKVAPKSVQAALGAKGNPASTHKIEKIKDALVKRAEKDGFKVLASSAGATDMSAQGMDTFIRVEGRHQRKKFNGYGGAVEVTKGYEVSWTVGRLGKTKSKIVPYTTTPTAVANMIFDGFKSKKFYAKNPAKAKRNPRVELLGPYKAKEGKSFYLRPTSDNDCAVMLESSGGRKTVVGWTKRAPTGLKWTASSKSPSKTLGKFPTKVSSGRAVVNNHTWLRNPPKPKAKLKSADPRGVFYAKTRGGKFELAVIDRGGMYDLRTRKSGNASGASLNHPSKKSIVKHVVAEIRNARQYDGINYLIEKDQLGVGDILGMTVRTKTGIVDKAMGRRNPTRKAKTPTKAQYAKVAKEFRSARNEAAKIVPDIAATKLTVNSEIHDSPRAFAMAGLVGPDQYPEIVIAPQLAFESLSVIRGILYHELGHIAQFLGYGQALGHGASKPKGYDAIERQADRIAEKLFSKKIYYDKRGVETIYAGKGYSRPRPKGLK